MPTWLVLLFSIGLGIALVVPALLWLVGAMTETMDTARWRLWGERRQDAQVEAFVAARRISRLDQLGALGAAAGLSPEELTSPIGSVSRQARSLRAFYDGRSRDWLRANPEAPALPPDFGVSLMDTWREQWRVEEAALRDK
jgi:hypothetical protein